jgi:hypothetical protein
VGVVDGVGVRVGVGVGAPVATVMVNEAGIPFVVPVATGLHVYQSGEVPPADVI